MVHRFTPRVSVSTYQASHGRSPRGFGTWMFSLSNGAVSATFTVPSSTYGAAKKRAVMVARLRFMSLVTVLP